MKKNKKIKIIIIIFLLLIITVIGYFKFFNNFFSSKNKIIASNNIIETNLKKNIKNEEKIECEKNLFNILLVGIDNRDNNKQDARTDSIMIATLDPTNNKIKLTSLMRDMLVEIPEQNKFSKINSAYSIGNIDLLKDTIKYNFAFDLKHYIIIDFNGFQQVVDIINGIDIDIKPNEVKEINKYIKEVNGNKSTLLKDYGKQHLNGQQALSYCRIRKVGNSDYERTERQRKALTAILSKCKNLSLSQYKNLISASFKYIDTDLNMIDIVRLAYTTSKFSEFNIETLRIPMDNCFIESKYNKMDVLIPDLERIAKELYKFIYNTEVEKLDFPNNDKVKNRK